MEKGKLIFNAVVLFTIIGVGYYLAFQYCPGEYYYQVYTNEYIERCCNIHDGIVSCLDTDEAEVRSIGNVTTWWISDKRINLSECLDYPKYGIRRSCT